MEESTMSTYVMADIHGHLNEFMEMLNQIGFSNEDELILAGDYIDRGNQSLEMLKWVEKCPDRVILLKGNHDVEFAECIGILDHLNKSKGLNETNLFDTKKLYKTIWQIPETKDSCFDYYGTIENLIMYKQVTLADLKRWADLIKEMPYFCKRIVNGKTFIIVHAGYYEDDSTPLEKLEKFYLYSREMAYTKGGVKGTTIIAGHTPTIIKGLPMYTDGEVYHFYDKEKDCTFYDIDCGCGFNDSEWYQNGRLACIRLEDEEVFYV